MSWNYRIIEHDIPGMDHPKHITYERWFGIHEIYYDDAGRVNGWTEDAIRMSGESPQEIGSIRMQILEALRCPVLRESALRAQETAFAS